MEIISEEGYHGFCASMLVYPRVMIDDISFKSNKIWELVIL